MVVRAKRLRKDQKGKKGPGKEKLKSNGRSEADIDGNDSDDSEFVPLEESDDDSVSLEPEEVDVEEDDATCQQSANSRKARTVKGKRKAAPKSNLVPKGKNKKAKKELKRADGAEKETGKEDSDESEQIWGPFGKDDDEINPDDLVRSRVFKEAEPPEGLLMDLLPFQKEFLAWGIEQERSKMKGGILADEVLVALNVLCSCLFGYA